MDHKYDIGIVIVNYNVRHFLLHCLQSIKNSALKDLSLEIWVVDNASVDGAVGLVRKEFPDVNIITNEKNIGFSAANNQAIAKMDSKYILLLNPDTVIEEETLQKCHDFMESHYDTGALGVRMIDGTGKFLPESKRKIPDIWNSFCKLTYLSDLFPTSEFFSGYNLGYLAEDETHEIDVLCGAFMFIRQSVLKETGLLDEAFFMYGEDIDLSYRILKAGYKIYYYPETSIIHYKGESTKKSSLNYVKTFYGAMHIYVNKHYGKGNAALFAKLIGIAISVRAFFSGLTRLLSGWTMPIIDALIIWLVLSQIKLVWAVIYFHDIHYYQETNIDVIFIVYTLIWTFFLWLGGHYDSIKNVSNTIISVATGTFFILIGYALLPETMRTSRAIILIGTLVTLLICFLTSFISRIFRKKSNTLHQKYNIAIVAHRENAEKLFNVLSLNNVSAANIHYISPEYKMVDTWFTNNISALPAVVRALKVDEVIYSSEDLSMKEIIKSMTQLESKVTFRIGGDDSLSIIGSHSKNQQGELYSLEVSYNLSQLQNLRYKRLLDVILSTIFMPFLPVLYVFNGFRVNIFLNVFGVFLGNYTWVGFGGVYADYSFLPEISMAIIKYPLSSKTMNYSDDYFKRANIIYAKDYSVWTDIKVIFENLYKLSNKPPNT